MVLLRRLGIIALLCASCEGIDEMQKFHVDDVLTDSSETQIGNVITDLRPENPFPNFGQYRKMIKVAGNNSAKSRDVTLYINVKPPIVQVDGQFNLGRGPFTGKLLYGAGGGFVEVEFDLNNPRRYAWNQAGNGDLETGGLEYQRSGITVVSFNASNFEFFVRHDGNQRTVLPFNGPGDPAGSDEDELPVTVSAHAAIGQRAAVTKLYRTIWVSNCQNGTVSQIAAGATVGSGQPAIPIPAAAKRVFVYRSHTDALSNAPVANQIPPIRLRFENYDFAFPFVANLGADDMTPIEIPPYVQGIEIENISGAAYKTVALRFELEL